MWFWNHVDDTDEFVCCSTSTKSGLYRSLNKFINIKLKLVFSPHENVRQSVRKRAVSKEELHLQITWWGQQQTWGVWWCQWCGEFARSSSSLCIKVINKAGWEPNRTPSESEDHHKGKLRISVDKRCVFLDHTQTNSTSRLQICGVWFGKSPTEHAQTEAWLKKAFERFASLSAPAESCRV